MADFIRLYNRERYHEGIGHVTPADVYDGRREAILRQRAAQKGRTLARRVRYNRASAMQGTQGELTGDLAVPCSLTESQRC
jgi:putative transposase